MREGGTSIPLCGYPHIDPESGRVQKPAHGTSIPLQVDDPDAGESHHVKPPPHERVFAPSDPIPYTEHRRPVTGFSTEPALADLRHRAGLPLSRET